MRNLYFETVEALFEADIKPWDIENVSMVDRNSMAIIRLEWDEFISLAKEINYKTHPSANVIDDSLTIACTNGRLLIRSNMLGKEGWRYTETGLYEHEGVKNLSPKDFITKCNDKELNGYYEIEKYTDLEDVIL